MPVELIVSEIYIAENAGEPMTPLQQVEAIAGDGFKGDRYSETKKKGHWQLVNPQQKMRQGSMIFQSDLDAANSEFGTHFDGRFSRRNLVIVGNADGVDLENVEFNIGEVRVRGAKTCAPCPRPSELGGEPGFQRALQNKGGWRFEFLNSGMIYVGSKLVIPAR